MNAIVVCLMLAAPRSDPGIAVAPTTEPYEILRSDAAWCGPRVVYFFACYDGQTCTLEEVVRLCRTDDDGFTTLLDLVGAARELGLEPVPVSCTADQLLALEGPAIFCVPGRSPEGTREAVHFLGMVGRDGNDYRVIDPSRSTRVLLYSPNEIRSAFIGQAVLLRGCPQPMALTLRWYLVVAACLLSGMLCFSNWRRVAGWMGWSK